MILTVGLTRRRSTSIAANFLRISRSALAKYGVVRCQATERHGRSAALAERLVEILDALADDRVGLARNHLVGPHLVFEVLHEIGAEDRPQAAERHRQVEIEAVTHGRFLVHLVLRHQEHAKGLEPGVPKPSS